MAEWSKTYPSQAQLRLPSLFLNALKAAIIATDLSGIVIYWNPFAEKLYGWSQEEVLGRNIMDITVSSETEEEARKYMAECWREIPGRESFKSAPGMEVLSALW